ncbi:hypothetical protein QT937_017255 [Xanthomonas campestris pv. campestris]|uniref:hypothetical protein n=1 Tax=Xanthomonas campestris TaxID=339 RepID=UPI0025A2BE5C|nr:hypothetical protein [Xanthomonas campestris]MDM7697006.1 hypothetical protein [Xanthomonas campestris pv. campestris]
MIDTTYLDTIITMKEQQFIDIAEAETEFVLINIIPVVDSEKWAIFGPYGVYVSTTGNRAFPNLASAHDQLKTWGIRKFFQVGDLKVFS